MSEKRFLWIGEHTIIDNKTGNEYSSLSSCLLLNSLNDENEQLKYDNEALKGVFESYCSISEHFQKELREENEQLRKLLKVRQFEKDINKCRDENRRLQEVLSENEKLLQKDLDMLTELRRENKQLRQTTKTQQIRIYCQDQQIQKLQNQLNQIPPNIKEVWLE